MTDNLFSVAGKRVLITGGSSGIGRMLVEGLAERGARVFTVSRKQAVLDEIVAELTAKGYDVAAAAVDLAEPGAAEKAAELVSAHFGGELDVLVNNAGATWGGALDAYPEDGWDKVFDLNVKSLFFLTQKCLPMLRKAATVEDRSRVINIGSINGIAYPTDNAWAYHPAKAAVHHLTKTLARALAAENISVNALAPGFFPSKMTRFAMPGGDDSGISSVIPMKRTGRADDIIGAVVFFASRASAYVTGDVLKLDGGIGFVS